MTDVIWTIIGAWVIWKIWAAFSSVGSSKNVVLEKHEHHHHHYQNNTSKQTASTDTKKKFGDDEGEYVEFEEIKK